MAHRMDESIAVFPLRRQVLKMFGAAALAGAGKVMFAQNAAVVGSPSLTEGPYFVDEDLNRRDIRVDPSDGSIQPGSAEPWGEGSSAKGRRRSADEWRVRR